MGIELRPYQRDAVKAIYDYYEKNDGNILLILPTGSGKSLIQAAFVRDALEAFPGERILLVSHVRELLAQNAEKLRALWPEAPIGIYSAGLGRRETQAAISIAGIQSSYRRATEFGPISLVIVDECHSIPKKGQGMYRRFLSELKELNPQLKIIGMSATPYRLDSGLLHDGEGAIFTDVAYEARIPDLVKAGYLCPLISKLGATRADLSRVKVRGGEYVAADLEKTVDTRTLIAGAVEEMLSLCADRNKWLIFCCGVAHARHVCEELRRRGVSAAWVTGETPTAERDQILADFKTGSLRAVTNVNVLTTGFDAPDIDAIILLRPTLSPGLWYQMVGRGLRLSPSKQNTAVLDFGGNILRHGPIDQIRISKKPEGGGVETAPMRECPTCRALVPIAAARCEACGHVFDRGRKPKHDTSASELEVMSGQNDLIRTLDVDRVSYSPHVKPGKPASLRVVYHAGMATYSEWVCLEHDGYPRKKAETWWLRRASPSCRTVPETVFEALQQTAQLGWPRQIVVSLSGRYPDIIAHRNIQSPTNPPMDPTTDLPTHRPNQPAPCRLDRTFTIWAGGK